MEKNNKGSFKSVKTFGESEAMGISNMFDNTGQTLGPILFGYAMTFGYSKACLFIGAIAAVLLSLLILGRRSSNMKGHVQTIKMEDIDEIVYLHSKYLNHGRGIKPHFEKVLSEEFNISLKYVIDKKIKGLFIATKGIFLSGGHYDICNKIKKMTKDEICYTGDALLIIEEERHKGILEELGERLHEELLREKAKYVIFELWRYPDGKVPAHNILKIYKESIYLGNYKNFYKDFYKDGYICPICGKDCICSADIYVSRV